MGLLGFALFPFVLTAVGVAQSSGLAVGVAVGFGVLLLLSVVNTWQNGPPTHPAPAIATLADVRALRSKADAVAAWRAAPAPALQSVADVSFDAELLPLSITAPVEWLITHVLFAPGKRWLGKHFGAGTGINRFAPEVRRHPFALSVAPSAFDGRPSLVLDYSDPQRGSTFWGRVVGMRDEVRLVAPGVYVGLGSLSLTAFGLGFGNCSAFVLWPAADRSR